MKTNESSVGHGRQAARRLGVRLRGVDPLIDDPVGVLVTGCAPGALVVVRAGLDDGGTAFEATASFDADEAGTVDTARAASRGGTYEGIDPFGLWWSGEMAGPSAATVPAPMAAPMRCRLRVESDGEVVESVVERHWLAPGTVVTEVREAGVWGFFARPAGRGPFPGVVAFGGSGGGLGPAAAWAPLLASHGFAVLAIAYFGIAGLPPSLVGIEIEVVERAVRWLRDRSDVAPDTVAVMGQSRGSELALLASALVDGVGPVVAFAPSGVSWGGLDAGGPVDAPAWTFRGDAIPYAGIGAAARPGVVPTDDPLALRPAFVSALEDEAAVHRAEIPVERAKGPILMVSGDEDAMWPSVAMGQIVERRAVEHGLPHPVVHLCYPDAGHVCAGVPGTPIMTEVRHPITGGFYSFGGTRAGNARARADSWPQVLAFLRTALPA